MFLLFFGSSDDCLRRDPDCHQMEIYECFEMYPSKADIPQKLNKTEDFCYTLYRSDNSDKFQECKNQISTFLPLLDV